MMKIGFLFVFLDAGSDALTGTADSEDKAALERTDVEMFWPGVNPRTTLCALVSVE